MAAVVSLQDPMPVHRSPEQSEAMRPAQWRAGQPVGWEHRSRSDWGRGSTGRGPFCFRGAVLCTARSVHTGVDKNHTGVVDVSGVPNRFGSGLFSTDLMRMTTMPSDSIAPATPDSP